MFLKWYEALFSFPLIHSLGLMGLLCVPQEHGVCDVSAIRELFLFCLGQLSVFCKRMPMFRIAYYYFTVCIFTVHSMQLHYRSKVSKIKKKFLKGLLCSKTAFICLHVTTYVTQFCKKLINNSIHISTHTYI